MSRASIDYAAVRDQACFEMLLSRYGLEPHGQGTDRMIRCPFHDDRSPSCSINLEKKVFHCFACGETGTILDFVARMESCSLPEAVQRLGEQGALSGSVTAPAGRARVRSEGCYPNQPLTFNLPLDPHHPYLTERGICQASVEKFGLGYCDSGIMKRRICIPLHDEGGRLIAYAGRWPGLNPPKGQPRYKFPRGFRKRLVLFNYHRIFEAKHLVIVEGFWSVFALDALGIAAVALMGCGLSKEQETLVQRSLADHVTLLLDGDEAGRGATPDILSRLARYHFVHAPDLPDGADPDTMDTETLVKMIRN
jgi:DNA primase